MKRIKHAGAKLGRLRLERKSIEHEFLPDALEVLESPPAPLGRLLIWIVCALIVAAFLWSVLCKVDEEAIARGKLVPDGKVKVVQLQTDGVITAIHVRDGQHVRAGDKLCEFDDTMAKAELRKLTDALQIARLEHKMLGSEYTGRPVQNVDGGGVKSAAVNLQRTLSEARQNEYKIKREQAQSAIHMTQNQIESNQAYLMRAKERLELLNKTESVRRDLQSMDAATREDLDKAISVRLELEGEYYSRIETVEELEDRKKQETDGLTALALGYNIELLKSIVENEKKLIELEAE